jgi:hypothetical protein
MKSSPTSAVHASQGHTIVFTYTAATGGISGGSISLVVPTGWSAPSKTGTAAGYTSSSKGTVSVSGRTITVAAVTLAAGQSVTISYGSRASGGAGATAPTAVGPQTWQTKERSSTTGALVSLAASPSIKVT